MAGDCVRLGELYGTPESEGCMKICLMKWVVIKDVVVHASTAGEIPGHVWQQFLGDLKKKRVTKALGLSLGQAAVTSLQRKEASEVSKAQNIKSAIVTDDSLVRGVLTAMSWLGANVKPFSWAQLGDAIKFLELDTDTESLVLGAARSLRQELQK
jgi:hypothetical protein